MPDVIPIVKDYILRSFLQGEDPESLTRDTELIRSGIIDSLATLELVSFLEESFSIELQAHDIGPANLGTLESIDRLVQAKLNGQ